MLVMEQIMSTGGGWQDQVGGVTNGIKYITSKPGLDQQLRVEHIELQLETKKELNERFCLIYTRQRRLARNLLRDVVGRYVGNEPDSLYALNEIQKVAALMCFELERGKIDEFADLLKKAVTWTLRTIVACIVGVNVVQGLLAPAIDTVKRSALTRTAEALPWIGNVMGGMAEVTMGVSKVVP